MEAGVDAFLERNFESDASVRDFRLLRLYRCMKSNTSQPAPPNNDHLMQETLRIPGMTCGGCVRLVSDALQILPVQLVSISVGQATVSFDVRIVSREHLVETVQKAGYKVQ